MVKVENLLGKEVDVGRPANSTNIHHTVTGGVTRRLTQSENLGRAIKSTNWNDRVKGGKGEVKGGVYSDGPRNVYNRLNCSPISQDLSNAISSSLRKNKKTQKTQKTLVLPSASLRLQHQLAQSIKSRKRITNSSLLMARPDCSDREVELQWTDPNYDGVTRGDFNVVLKVGERRGSSGGGGQAERDNFAHFTDVMEVVDVPVMGKKFSWFNADGSTMSRLDHFLVSEEYTPLGTKPSQEFSSLETKPSQDFSSLGTKSSQEFHLETSLKIYGATSMLAFSESSSAIEITAYLASMPTNARTLSSHTLHPCQPMPMCHLNKFKLL
ncbi:unnamed protein product [Trifolium pratense]|uniref:Uncharacterized protein n=1 Tax=Trifolium pratense TaxID=57577 RepID=A0ACB0IP49_TRIPR|nr:unnamed protein product [Trifolium pratense]